MWYSYAQTNVRQVSFATNLQIRNSIIVMAVVTVEVLIAGMQVLEDALRTSFNRTVESKVFIEQEVPALTRVVNGKTEHAWMDLVFNLSGSVTYLDVSIVATSLAIRPWSQQPAQNQDIWPRERRRANLTGTRTSISFLSSLRQQADLVHMPGNSLTICCEMLTTHQLLSDTLGPPSKVFFTVPSPNNNSRQPLRDSWGLLSHPAAIYIWHSCLLVQATRERTQPFSVSSPLQLCHVALL